MLVADIVFSFLKPIDSGNEILNPDHCYAITAKNDVAISISNLQVSASTSSGSKDGKKCGRGA